MWFLMSRADVAQRLELRQRARAAARCATRPGGQPGERPLQLRVVQRRARVGLERRCALRFMACGEDPAGARFWLNTVPTSGEYRLAVRGSASEHLE